jgi:hypothetical protein
MFANCYALGMAGVDDILCEEGCSVFSVTQDEGHHLSQLPLVKSKFRALSPDLRPIDKQLTFGHHPYVVCLLSNIMRIELTELGCHPIQKFPRESYTSSGMQPSYTR